ncbi:MAG: hypothetical protein CME24_15260 [Gemmatimonadetes bacterium]|nr:hypothetical protein [Gemmatimonadota bacterium]
MSHNETVRTEFTRQAETFRASKTLSVAEVTTRVGEALGDKGYVLDVACGPGLLLPTLSTPSRTVVGVDLTHHNLQLAAGVDVHGAAHLVEGLAEALPFAPRSFDAVVIRLALHHFADPAVALKAAHPVLKPGGRLVVLDVLGPEDDETRSLRDAIERFRDPSHTSVLNATTMRQLLQRTGYELVDETLWSQDRVFSEWAKIMNEPRRMADLEQVLRALVRNGDDPSGLGLTVAGDDLAFKDDWGLFVAQVE